jgi:hypothetical protein
MSGGKLENMHKTKQKLLIRKIRKHPKYMLWKRKVLKRDGWSEKDKGIQVHHHPKEISTILAENRVYSLGQAVNCDELWDVDNGIVLSRGEHFVITKLRRYKYLTKGFIILLETWFEECKKRPKKVSKVNKR